jgi:chromosome partitioning protein
MAAFVITVANRKGGTGKSTTAVQLAAAAAESNVRVLLVDLDSQGHSGYALGQEARRGETTAHSIYDGDSSGFLSSIRHDVMTGLDLSPADLHRQSGPITGDPRRLAHVLSVPELTSRYELVIVDTGPAYDADMVSALAASQAVLVPFLPHPLSLKGIRQFSRVFLTIRTSLNPTLRNFGLVGCQFNQTSVVQRSIMQQVAAEFGAEKLMGVIRMDVRLAECAGLGRTVFTHAPHSRGASDYRDLANAVLDTWLPKRQCQLTAGRDE